MPEPLRIFVLAGEPSGDALGGRLMRGLSALAGTEVQFSGVGGEQMASAGLASMFDMAELSLMGLAEVLPRAPRLLRRIAEVVAVVCRTRPDAVVTIDAPGFNFRVARRLRGCGLPLIHYVAPQVWAWRPGRARMIATFLDHLLALFPFEPPLFEAEGLACTFVGHPVVEDEPGDGGRFRRAHGMGDRATVLAVLPGSRAGEVKQLLPAFGAAVALLGVRYPDLRVVVPTVSGVAAIVTEAVARWSVPSVVVRDAAAKRDAVAAAGAALCASGTAVLELARAGVPMVVGYRMNPITMAVARRLVRLPHVSLLNIIVGREVVPEFLQERCRPDLLANAVAGLLDDPSARAAQREAAAAVATQLGAGAEAPSLRAARAVLSVTRTADARR